MSRKPFINPEKEAIEEEWKKISTRTFTDYELEEFDVRLERYNHLGTRADLERFYVDVHCASRQYPPGKGLSFLEDPKSPGHLSVERVDNKISQWSDWRRKKFGSVRRIAGLEKQAAENIGWGPFDEPEKDIHTVP
jgi:hypothetical protein